MQRALADHPEHHGFQATSPDIRQLMHSCCRKMFEPTHPSVENGFALTRDRPKRLACCSHIIEGFK